MVNMKASNAKMLSTLISAMGSDRMGASIAAVLNISKGTVKVHEHNIHQRLDISTNAELFRRFINCLTGPL